MIRNALSILVFVATAVSPAFAQTGGRIRERSWFNVGGGVGAMTCKRCDGGNTGLVGDIGFGGTLSPQMLIAFTATGWTKSVGGTTLLIGTLGGRFRLYTSLNGGAHVTAAVGLGVVNGAFNAISSPNGAYTEPEYGTSLELGFGYDARIRPMLSLTPFVRGLYVKTESADGFIAQIGLGITSH